MVVCCIVLLLVVGFGGLAFLFCYCVWFADLDCVGLFSFAGIVWLFLLGLILVIVL